MHFRQSAMPAVSETGNTQLFMIIPGNMTFSRQAGLTTSGKIC
ncbi:hypothetical protein GTPT_3137 [Tatumella ptyseos ATCC 33301]|uniref:Uncharacterized protein n=1 Tax=Tatumella ptyseos ATCC 33301 TaxID=1005995 RepID=A0A085JAN6_9GAMM|nr:hypothetical protein GTPT_3137 [Tatumella ptyseos ATCC 33301]